MTDTWPPFMTTAVAAVYCGFKTTGALRKAFMEGRVFPVGKNDGRGTYVWGRAAPDVAHEESIQEPAGFERPTIKGLGR